MNVCFFVRLKSSVKTESDKIFNSVEFYNNDIKILKKAGFKVDYCYNLSGLLKKKYDLYYIWWYGYGVFPAAIAFLLNKPSIVIGNIHTVNGQGLSSWPFYKKNLMKLCMKLASKSFFTSKKEIERLGKFKPRSSDILYNCVNPTLYKPNEKDIKEKVILTISNLTKENVKRKMILESLHAFKLFQNYSKKYTYIICGRKGDGLELINEKIQSLGLLNEVKIIGDIPINKKITLLNTCSLYLQPSLAEGFGVSILEAQSCGAPVLTSYEPCINEIFGESVLRAEGAHDLCEKMNYILTNNDIYEKYVNLGFVNSKKYSFKIREEKIKSTIKSLLKL